jgi:uridylate kinase
VAKKGNNIKLKYRRILLKLSGEVLRNRETGDSIDASRLAFMAERVKKIHALGVEVGIVLEQQTVFIPVRVGWRW